jgi:hypothetical protein
MTFPRFESSAVRLFRYTIASADMYFAEMEERDVFVGRDDEGHVRIWGELVGGSPSTKVELCGVFLEQALYCGCCYTTSEAHTQMEAFGQRMGRRLAAYLQKNPTLVTSKNSALGALECLFGTIRAGYFEDYADSGARFVVTDCPLEEASRRSGLPYIELARHGINAMCQSLCVEMNPGAVVRTLPPSRPEFVFTISLPVAA